MDGDLISKIKENQFKNWLVLDINIPDSGLVEKVIKYTLSKYENHDECHCYYVKSGLYKYDQLNKNFTLQVILNWRLVLDNKINNNLFLEFTRTVNNSKNYSSNNFRILINTTYDSLGILNVLSSQIKDEYLGIIK